MNTTDRPGDRDAGDRLDLPACPICHEERSPSRNQATMSGTGYVWYECEACHSALLSLGNGRWTYQKVTRPGHAHLLRKPMTVSELRRLLPTAAPPRAPLAPAFPERATVARPVTPGAPSPRVEAASREPEPAAPIERDPTGIEALRATLAAEEVPAPEADAARGDEPKAALPSPFITAVVVLVVLLLLGLVLTVLVGWWPN